MIVNIAVLNRIVFYKEGVWVNMTINLHSHVYGTFSSKTKAFVHGLKLFFNGDYLY